MISKSDLKHLCDEYGCGKLTAMIEVFPEKQDKLVLTLYSEKFRTIKQTTTFKERLKEAQLFKDIKNELGSGIWKRSDADKEAQIGIATRGQMAIKKIYFLAPSWKKVESILNRLDLAFDLATTIDPQHNDNEEYINEVLSEAGKRALGFR